MRGPETPNSLRRVSDRMSRSRLWNAVHRHDPQSSADGNGSSGAAPEAEQQAPVLADAEPVRLGERGTPVAAPRRARR
jgi:hypothetical protein